MSLSSFELSTESPSFEEVRYWIEHKKENPPPEKIEIFFRSLQTRIEYSCIPNTMRIDQVISYFEEIPSDIIDFVWKRMEVCNPKFFRFYYLLLRVMDQEVTLKHIKQFTF